MHARPAFVVALTGGIASGKDTVSRCFEAHGIAIYDADWAAREVTQPGTEALKRIINIFGHQVIKTDGQLDRRQMRQHIFANPKARQILEASIHPYIRCWLYQHAQADTGPYCLLAIPLLVECLEHYRWIHRVLLVDVDETAQIKRLMTRDDIDEDLALRMLAAQSSRQQRLDIADDVIHNNGDSEKLNARVATLHTQYLALAHQTRKKTGIPRPYDHEKQP